MKRRVLIAFPTAWDERQLAALRPAALAPYELVLDEPHDADVRWDFDILGYVDARARSWRGRLHGVTSTSDYPGAIAAAAIAAELSLPGSPPAAVLQASHKYYARLLQRDLAPESVPRFTPADPLDRATWPAADALPCFVKPVKASFSLFARYVRDVHELAALLESPAVTDFCAHYVRMFDLLAGRYRPFELDGRWFLAEEPLRGEQVTVEGWVSRGEPAVMGIVDTSFHPGTRSFARFDYPSALPLPVQERMGALACRLARALGLDDGLFNVELLYDRERERIGIVEINPRCCGQFADLYEKVDGTNGYEVALALAGGQRPQVRRGAGPFAAAASFPLRTFRPALVRSAPGPEDVHGIEARDPGSLIWVECRAGERLLDTRDEEDGQSQRYAVLNLGGRDRKELEEKCARIERELAFDLAPLERPAELPRERT